MVIQYFNRHTDKIEEEKVYGDKAIRWLYLSQSGRFLAPLISSSFFSTLYGKFQDLSISRRKIDPFIENFHIKMDDFLSQENRNFSPDSFAQGYDSFNQFFIRRFRPGVRQFCDKDHEMPAFSEARYFAAESVNDSLQFPVKGAYLRAADLVGKKKWASFFEGGPLLIARLCPVDYHRFHFPDDGKVLDRYPLAGPLHSVNPIALKARPKIFITNKREVSILETKNFGRLAYIEVGATCVGKIVQSYHSEHFKRGDEKGHFLFGGSTVVVLGEKGKWRPSDLLLEHSEKGREVYSQMGEMIAQRV